MKKLLSALIILAMIVCAFSVISFAEDADAGYTINGKDPGSLALPSAIQGYGDAVDGVSTIVLTKDIEIPYYNGALNIQPDRTVVLDLNGHTLTTESRRFILKSNSNLTIKNGTLTGAKAHFDINAASSLTIDDITLNGAKCDGNIINAGSLTVNDSTLNLVKPIDNKGALVLDNADITITDSIKMNTSAANPTLTICGGTKINASTVGNVIDMQTSSTSSPEVTIYKDTEIVAGTNVIYANNPNSKTTIYGGTFTSNASTGRILKFAANSPLEIYGGTFKNSVKGTSNPYSTAFDSCGNNCKVYGGTFYFDPTNASWVNRNDYAIKNSAGVFTVTPKEESFSVWGNGEELTFADAVNFVENNGTITLNKNATLTKRLAVSGLNKTFTIDLNGKTLKSDALIKYSNSGQVFELKDNSDITLVNGTITSDIVTTSQGENSAMIFVGTTWADETTEGKLTLGGDGNTLLIKGSPSTNIIAQNAIKSTLVVNDGVTLEIPKGANTTNCIYTRAAIVINGGEFINNGNGSLDKGFINSVKFQNASALKAEVKGGKFYNNIENERKTTNLEITGGTFYGKLFGISSGNVYYDLYTSFSPDGYYENEYDGYVKVETTSNKESVTAAIANASYDDGKGENTVTKRFFKMVNSLDYAVVGFEIKAGEYTWDIPLTSVYSKVLVNGKVYNAGENEYVLTGAIGDVPNNYDGGFEVSAYAIDFEGNKVPLN